MDIDRPVYNKLLRDKCSFSPNKKKILVRVVNLGTFYKVYPFHEMV